MEPFTIPAAHTSAPSPAPSLRRHFAWTLAGNVVYAGCQWAILAVIARLSDASAVGEFALGLAVTAPIFLLAGLQLRAVQATDAARDFEFADYLSVRITGMVVAIGVTAAFVGTAGYDWRSASVILLLGVTKAIEGVSDACYGALQQHERMDAISHSLMLRGVLSVLAVALVLWFGGTLSGAVTAMAACWVAVALGHDIPAVVTLVGPLGERIRPTLRPAVSRRIAVVAFPLGVVLALISLRTNIPRYFMERAVGTSELGIFAALSSLVVAGNLVISALGQSATPRLARYHFQGNGSAFRKLVGKLVMIGAVIGGCGVLLAWAVGEPLLRMLFGPVYARHVPLLLFLMAGGVLAYVGSFLGFALTAARQFRIQLPLFAVSAGACSIASWILVPRLGAFGAAAAWMLSLLFEVIAVAAILWRLKARSPVRDPA